MIPSEGPAGGVGFIGGAFGGLICCAGSPKSRHPSMTARQLPGADEYVQLIVGAMVSLENAPADFTKTMASAAMLVAGLGGVLLIGIAEPFTRFFYAADYSPLAQFLPVIGFFLVLQILVDTALVELILKKMDRLILILCLAVILISPLTLAFLDARWYPVFCAGLFCVLFAMSIPKLFIGQVILRGIVASLVAVFIAYFIEGWLGISLGFVTFFLALVIDANLRRAIIDLIFHFLPVHKTSFDG